MATLPDFFDFPGLTLEPIQESDFEPTVAIINRAYAYQDEFKGEPRTNLVRLRQRSQEVQLVVAKQGSKIVACVYVEPRQKSVHFGLLTVVDEFRGTGLGASLISAVEAYARALGAEKVELDYMSAAPWLKHYYEKFGFTATGKVTNWGKLDLIRMAKPLR